MHDKKQSAIRRASQAAVSTSRGQNRISWKFLEQQVMRLQKQIAQASRSENREVVYRLQQRVLESEAARLLAVHRMAEENQGKRTAGVDGVKSLTARECLEMASAIHPGNWADQPSAPARRIWIPKPGTTEQRPLAILPMIDRCKQALVKMALEPEWEVRFEAHSYGFRPNRGAHDAIAALLVAIEHQPAFVLSADLTQAFDLVSQTEILEKLQTSPFLRKMISIWLKAGIMDGGIFFPSERGIPQGSALSPLLLNVALHGMEAVAAQGAAIEPPLLVRYADNFVIMHADLTIFQKAVRRIRLWLATQGLQLNEHKTDVWHTLISFQGRTGFDFLGFHLCQEAFENSSQGKKRPLPHGRNMKTIVAPSGEADRRHRLALEQRLQLVRVAPQAQVIAELNPLIRGWTGYYNGLVDASIMSQYDNLVEELLLVWANRRHPGKDRTWLLSRYWQRDEHQRRRFAAPNGVQLLTYQQAPLLRKEDMRMV
jgi:RNA-directed DNA polymerase